MNRIFYRIFPLTLLAITIAAVAIYFLIRALFGDPLEEIARKQAAGPIFLLEQYIDHAPPDEWLARLNRVREVSEFSLELLPLAGAAAALPADKRAALERGEVVLDIPHKSFLRRVDLRGDRYVGSDEEVLQVSRLPIDIGLELEMESLRYAIVALCLLIPILYWSRSHWRELLALARVAEDFGAGKLATRAATQPNAAVYPLALCMNQMAERIEGLLEAQRQLMHSVSHELRTPIARLEFGLELLRDELDGARGEARIRSMEEDVHELKALVNELLNLARLDQQCALQSALVEVEPLLRECAGKLEHALAGKQFALDVEAGLPPVHGDRRLLARAVGNLLLNATKYGEQRIALSAQHVGDAIAIAVEDDGPGIPAGERERVFEPFYRLDRSRDRATGGFGLGLAIAQRAARLHGGPITVDASVLGGARFVLRIPAADAQKKSLPEAGEGMGKG